MNMMASVKVDPETGYECSAEEWALRVDLACAYRLVNHFGWNQLIYNHLTVRVPGGEGHQFLINPFGLMYHEVTASNLIKIDCDGNKLSPSPHPVQQPGFIVHRSVHLNRHDAGAVMHTHSIAGVAVSCQAEGLLPMNLNACTFTGQIAYHDLEGIALEESECDRLAADLGDKTAMILRNHGLLTCGPTIADAFADLYNLERCCQIQLAAQSSGARLVMPPADLALHIVEQRQKGNRGENNRVAQQNQLLWASLKRWMGEVSPGFDR